jgi:hypothetical protein
MRWEREGERRKTVFLSAMPVRQSTNLYASTAQGHLQTSDRANEREKRWGGEETNFDASPSCQEDVLWL